MTKTTPIAAANGVAPLDRDDPAFIAERQRRWAFADGMDATLEELDGLIRHAIGPRRVLSAIRRLRHRCEVWRDDALKPATLIEKVFGGSW